MASSEANCTELRETVEILKSECTQELAARRKTAKDLQLSQEKLQALSVLTDQLRSEVHEARRSLKAAQPAPAEPVMHSCYEPIAVTEQALRMQATENCHELDNLLRCCQNRQDLSANGKLVKINPGSFSVTCMHTILLAYVSEWVKPFLTEIDRMY